MSKNLGRPREFDPQAFLNQAKDCFWQNGYRATSIADLMKASGLASASIYKLYPDKKAIFLAALTQYMDEGLMRLRTRAATLPPQDALRETLDYCAVISTGPDGERGCFTIAAANELLPGDQEVKQKVDYMFTHIQAAITQIITRGQADATFRQDIAAETIASGIFMMLEGMRVYGKVTPTLESLKKSNEFIMISVNNGA